MSWIAPTIAAVALLVGHVVAWRLRKKPEEVDVVSKLLDAIEKLRARADQQDEVIGQLRIDRDKDREVNARFRFHAMRYIERLVGHIEHDSAQMTAAGLTPTPIEGPPDELKPTGA